MGESGTLFKEGRWMVMKSIEDKDYAESVPGPDKKLLA